MGELRSLRDKQMAINLQLEELTGILTRVKDMLARLNLTEIENLKKKQKQMEEGREDSWESLKEINSNFNDTFKKIRQIDSELLKIQVEYKKKQMEKSNIGITLRNLGEIWKYQLAEYTYYVLLVEAIRYLLIPEKTKYKEGLKSFIQWDKLSPDSKLITPDNMKKWVSELSKNLQPLLLKLLEEKTDLTKLFTYSDDEKKLIDGISLLKSILAPIEQYQFLEAKTVRDIKNVIDAKMKILGDNRIANELTAFEIETSIPPTAPLPLLGLPEDRPMVKPSVKPIEKQFLRLEEPRVKPIERRIYEIDEPRRVELPSETKGYKIEEREPMGLVPRKLRRRPEEDLYDIRKYGETREPIEYVKREDISKVKDRLPLIVVERTK
jgi:hypothetical protein